MTKVFLTALLLFSILPALSHNYTQQEVDAYHPKSLIAKEYWPQLLDNAKVEVMIVEMRPYFNPQDVEDSTDILSIISYNMFVKKQASKEVADQIDENSYKLGFVDAHNFPLAKSKPKPKISLLKTIGYLGYAASAQPRYAAPVYAPAPPAFPTYIQRISAPTSPYPTYQVSNY